MVAANSSKISRVPLYLGIPTRVEAAFAYGAITRYGRLFQTVPLTARFVTLHRSCVTGLWLPRPPLRNARMLGTQKVWAGPGSLAATSGITIVFFSCGY